MVGGMKIEDPAVDLAICLAIASSTFDKVIPFDTVVLGEVGLASEVRSIANVTLRINEARKLGFKRCILPQTNYQASKALTKDEMKLIPIVDLAGAFKNLWGS